MQGPNDITVSWLVRLRWVAILAQSALVWGVMAITSVAVPVAQLHFILGIAAVTNLVLWRVSQKQVAGWIVPVVLGLDIILLTIALQLSGGPMNPFSFLYVVHVALAAFVVAGWATWVLLAMAVGGYGLLYTLAARDPHLHHHGMDDMQLHLDGMWVAMAVSAAFIVFFMTRLKGTLTAREAEIAQMRERQAQQDKLRTLTTLAAGAAHELSTPLASIAVASKELELGLKDLDADLSHEAHVIREETRRCRDILDRLAGQSGRIPGEEATSFKLNIALQDAVSRIRTPNFVSLSDMDIELFGSRAALQSSLVALIQNALDAGASKVLVDGALVDGLCRITIQDNGIGMTEEVLSRATEPFFTTKTDQNSNMGLGLFVARELAEQWGGSLQLQSRPGQTIVTLTLPPAP